MPISPGATCWCGSPSSSVITDIKSDFITLPKPALPRLAPLSMPIWPDSEEPKLLVINTFGKCFLKASCLASENTAPPEPTLKIADKSQRSGLASNASTKGIAIASPTICTALHFSFSQILQICSASKERSWFKITLLPASSCIQQYHQLAPCISGASAIPMIWFSVIRLTISSGFSQGPKGEKCPPAPIAAKNTFLWGHITPFGMPVVPPV